MKGCVKTQGLKAIIFCIRNAALEGPLFHRCAYRAVVAGMFAALHHDRSYRRSSHLRAAREFRERAAKLDDLFRRLFWKAFQRARPDQ